MHGQKRSEYKARLADPVVSAGLSQKARQWNTLSRELLVRRGRLEPLGEVKDATKAEETLKLTEKLLIVNPDPSHLWNHRRDLLTSDVAAAPASDGQTPSSHPSSQSTGSSLFVVENELVLTATCLRRNPKAYGAWFHRKWSLRRWLVNENVTGGERVGLLSTELGLCGDFLAMDERNFHCWNYRRFVVAAMAASLSMKKSLDPEGARLVATRLDGSWGWANPSAASEDDETRVVMGPQLTTTKDVQLADIGGVKLASEEREGLLQTEWEFTRKKIEKNFSNCSAFHYRSKLLPVILESRVHASSASSDRYQEVVNLAREELELVQNAVFTEPDDQTAWWYHRFLIAWAAPPKLSAGNDAYLELLREECDTLRDLVETEDGKCKWGLLGLHMVLSSVLSVHGGSTGEERREANECLSKLAILDPDRATRYESMKCLATGDQ